MSAPLEDAAFDALLSERARSVSATYWSPVAVARRAAQWITEAGATRVVDLGAGVGKLGIALALASESLQVHGIEQRPHLVTEAQRLAARLGVADRVRFSVGSIADLDVDAFDALYVFNPFSEHCYPAEARVDQSVALSPERMADDLAAFEGVLDAMRVGSLFVTYHGFRGTIPDTFDLTRWEQIGDSILRLWTKTSATPGGFRWAEVGEGLTLVPGRS